MGEGHSPVPAAWNIHVLINFNSLWPSDALCGHKSRSTLTHVMACYLTAPSNYPNQC